MYRILRLWGCGNELISYTSWGAYLQCNHSQGSTKYKCDYDPSKPVPPGADKLHAGREVDAHTGGYPWYSFPQAGEGKFWQEEYSKCPPLRIPASLVIKTIGQAGGRSCGSSAECTTCATCVLEMSAAARKQAIDCVFGMSPSPCPSPSPHYENPAKSNCRSDEKSYTHTSGGAVLGQVCAPTCGGGCPTDRPEGATTTPATAGCAIHDTNHGCANCCGLQCGSDAQCPAGARCFISAIIRGGVCMYPHVGHGNTSKSLAFERFGHREALGTVVI